MVFPSSNTIPPRLPILQDPAADESEVDAVDGAAVDATVAYDTVESADLDPPLL